MDCVYNTKESKDNEIKLIVLKIGWHGGRVVKVSGLSGSIHEDTVMDGHRQGKKANAYKYPLTFLKWWSSLVLKTFTVPAETIPSPNLFHSSQTLLANLNFPTSKRYLFLNSLKLCPLLAPSSRCWLLSVFELNRPRFASRSDHQGVFYLTV